MSRRRFAAMLFDLDGTLIDSMPLHHRAWQRWHLRHSLPFDEHGFFQATAGRTNAEILCDLLPVLDDGQRQALAEEKEVLYRELAEQHLQPVGGALQMLQAARAGGRRLAVCTASPPANLGIAIARFGLDRLVDAITSPADGLRGKPHPDIFSEAARRLGVAPVDCLVFEDAPLGVEAARRAGMAAVALTTTLPAAAFTHFDNLCHTMPNFFGFDPDTLVNQENEHA